MPEIARTNSNKERNNRLISNGNNWSQQQLTPSNNAVSNNNSFSNRQIVASTSTNQVVKQEVTSERKIMVNSPSSQMDHVILMRQFCIFYHYYLVELFVQLNYVKMSLGHL